MARLSPAARPMEPLEGVDGCFVLDLSMQQIEEMQTRETGDPAEHLIWLGENMLRDEHGERFEDLATREEVLQLPFSFVRDLNEAVIAHIRKSAEGNG